MKGYFQLLRMATENKSAYYSVEIEPNFRVYGDFFSFDTPMTDHSLRALLAESFRFWAEQASRLDAAGRRTFLLCDGSGRLAALFEAGELIEAGEMFEFLSRELMREPTLTETLLASFVRARMVPVECAGLGSIAMIGVLSANDDLSPGWLPAAALSFVPILRWNLEKRAAAAAISEKQQLEHEVKKRETLYQTAERLHSLIDVDSILTELIIRLRELFPAAAIDLLLSQDSRSASVSVKPLKFMRVDEDICTRAFMEGKEAVTHNAFGFIKEVALPLIGNQGVYGVIHFSAGLGELSSSDVHMLMALARTAGTAFENAKLYEQSNVLVSELRLINEITKRLNQSLQLNEIFDFASSELLNIFAADFSCILQLDRESGELLVQATNFPALSDENFAADYGFSGIVIETKEALIISDYWSNPRVQSTLMEQSRARSLIASPIIVNGDVVGVVLVAHLLPCFFTYDNYKLLQVLSSHIGLAIANASLHNEVKRMVITDNLTGLYERHYLDEQVTLHQKKDFCGSLIVVDIDNFKVVNDTYGHQVGDKILIQVSAIIRSCIRDTDIAARWGGEELAVYLPQVTRNQSMRIAERIRSRVVGETEPKVTVSCGISDWHWQDDKISVESLFYRSDMALYRAKHEGKNRIKIG